MKRWKLLLLFLSFFGIGLRASYVVQTLDYDSRFSTATFWRVTKGEPCFVEAGFPFKYFEGTPKDAVYLSDCTFEQVLSELMLETENASMNVFMIDVALLALAITILGFLWFDFISMQIQHSKMQPLIAIFGYAALLLPFLLPTPFFIFVTFFDFLFGTLLSMMGISIMSTSPSGTPGFSQPHLLSRFVYSQYVWIVIVVVVFFSWLKLHFKKNK